MKKREGLIRRMRAIDSKGPAAPAPDKDDEERHRQQRGGSGAASALERMKADHALRSRHGARTSGPGHEEDRTPER